LVVFLNQWVSRIPMAALVAVMIMVSIGTFSWRSILNLRSHPPSTSVVMLATVAVVVATHNLAFGVLVGVLISGLNFAMKVARYLRVESVQEGETRTYHVHGQIFFASADRFVEHFDLREALQKVVIDVRHAHFWDITAVGALDKVVMKFRRAGAHVDIIGMSDATRSQIDRFAMHNKPDAAATLASGH